MFLPLGQLASASAKHEYILQKDLHPQKEKDLHLYLTLVEVEGMKTHYQHLALRD